jgi:hypothetical protein
VAGVGTRRARRLELVLHVLDGAEEQRAVDAQDVELRARQRAGCDRREPPLRGGGVGQHRGDGGVRRPVQVDEQRRQHADEDRELELDRDRRGERHRQHERLARGSHE